MDLINISNYLCLILPYLFTAKLEKTEKVESNENKFRWEMNEDAMATEKLAEGIRKFGEDAVKLENIFKERLS